METLSAADSEFSSRIFALVEHLDNRVGLPLSRIFLYLAAHEGANQQEIGQALGLTQAWVSRGLRQLGSDKWDNLTEPPRKLIEVRQDLSNGRRKPCFLTPKGRMVLESLRPLIPTTANKGD